MLNCRSDVYVLAMGATSGGIVRTLGVNVPMYPLKVYKIKGLLLFWHITIGGHNILSLPRFFLSVIKLIVYLFGKLIFIILYNKDF